jgi:uncharacterized protein (TIGR00369 family)
MTADIETRRRRLIAMDIRTHQQIDESLCGKPILLEDGVSRVELLTAENMAVDKSGLVHGGFVFGLADYAAMIAVNHPNVVLGSAEVKFLKPVKIHEKIEAKASVHRKDGRKQTVAVTVHRGEEAVFQGEFICFVLERHVLA